LIIHGLTTPDQVDETDKLVNTKASDITKPVLETQKVVEEEEKDDTDDRNNNNNNNNNGPRWYDRILNKTKEFFEAEPDRDFL
jgi:hypothetical protein